MKNKGITLISLVVTVIVLLILAGISISMLSGDNGLLTRAGDARERTVIAQEEESAKLTFTEVQMELAQGKSVDSEQFQKMIDGNYGTGNATGTIGGESYIISVKSSGNNYSMDSSGNISNLAELPIDFEPGVLEQSGNNYTINSIEDLVAFAYSINSSESTYNEKNIRLGLSLDIQSDGSYCNPNTKYILTEQGYKKDETGTAIKQLLTDTTGIGFMPVGNGHCDGFMGIFDGNNCIISNLYMNAELYGGLFGWGKNNIEIKNLGMASCNIIGKYQTGSIIGSIYGTNETTINITNCYNTGTISSTSNYAGAIIGQANGILTINDCYSTGNVTGCYDVGGIIGVGYGHITGCYNTGKIQSNLYTGGILGRGNATIENCYNTGEIIGVYRCRRNYCRI